jgi:stage II sporulation protein E
MFIKTDDKNSKKIKLKILLFSSLISNAFLMMRNLENFTLWISISETIFSILFFYLMSPIIYIINKNRKTIDTKNIFSITIILSACLYGTYNLNFLNSYLFNFLFFFLILVMTNYFSCVWSCICVLLTGFILNQLKIMEFNSLLFFSLTAFFTGFIDSKNKIIIIASFLTSASSIAFILDKNLLNINFFVSSFFSVILFILVPRNKYKILENKEDNADHIKKILDNKLKKFSLGYKKISKEFENFFDTSLNKITDKQYKNISIELQVRQCKTCKKIDECWAWKVGTARDDVDKILRSRENGKNIEYENIPENFINNCIDLDSFIKCVNKIFELNDVSMRWYREINSTRNFLSQQLMSVSNSIKKLNQEFNNELFIVKEIEDKILLELTNNAIDVFNLSVINKNYDRLDIIIKIKNAKNITDKILKIINTSLNKKFICERSFFDSRNKNLVVLELFEQEKFEAETGISKCVKQNSEKSGDSYSIINLGCGKIALLVSDGMGSGNIAKIQSESTINIIENLLISGFDKETIINTVNSILLLKNTTETSTTLDACIVDLFNGNGNIIKISAPTSYLFRNNKLEFFISSSHALGILNDVYYNFIDKKFCDNDLLILMSDGVFDTLRFKLTSEDSKEEWLKKIIIEMKSKSAQEIADEIVDASRKMNEGEALDDITVLVLKLKQKTKII